MHTAFKAILAASTLAVTGVAAIQPAQAHDNTGAAVAAGIIGLGVGAALASDHPHYVPADYYGGGYYGGYPAYYYGAPYSYGYGYGYDRGWGGHYYRDDRRWDHGRDYRGWHDRGRDHWRR